MVAKVRPQAPRGELLREQLGRHGGLAVRRQRHALAAREVLHPRDVVRQRRAADDGQRIRQVVGQHIPALLCRCRRRGRARPPAGSSCCGDRGSGLRSWSSGVLWLSKFVAPAGVPVAGLHFAQRQLGAAQASCACGQRVRNTQPGRRVDAGWACRPAAGGARAARPGRARGDAASSACV